MPKIALCDTMIVWTRNKRRYRKIPSFAPPGSIVAFHGPDDTGAFARFPASAGCCDRDWREGDDAWRLARLAELVLQWVMEDGIRPDHVQQALRVIAGVERLDPILYRKGLERVAARQAGEGPFAFEVEEGVVAVLRFTAEDLDISALRWREPPGSARSAGAPFLLKPAGEGGATCAR